MKQPDEYSPWSSVTSKTAYIFMAAGLAVVFTVVTFFGRFAFIHPPAYRAVQNNLAFHYNDLADRIGGDTAKAAALSAQLGLKIRMQGPGIAWASDPAMPAFGPPSMDPFENIHSSMVQRGPIRYLFVLPPGSFLEVSSRHLGRFVGTLLVILFLSFFAVRWMFRPMGRLMRGVREISGGNLDFQFSAGPRGEFASLAGGFNQMASRVKEMVASKSRLLLDVSHELRSPLTRVKVALEMMPASGLKDSVMEDIGEMERMLQEILETEHLKSSHGGLKLQPLDLNALAAGMARKYSKRKPGVVFEGLAEGLELRADEARLRTVLQNVIENALRYSGEQSRPVVVSLRREGTRPVLHVRDHGVGIPEGDQALIFEPFYRVDKSRAKDTGGYGLGLSLCRQIMQAHGGEITLQSKTGQGTTVSLFFPA